MYASTCSLVQSYFAVMENANAPQQKQMLKHAVILILWWHNDDYYYRYGFNSKYEYTTT